MKGGGTFSWFGSLFEFGFDGNGSPPTHPYTHSSRLLANPQDVLCDSDLRRAFENKRRIPVVFLILAFSHRSKGHEKEDWLRRGRIRV